MRKSKPSMLADVTKNKAADFLRLASHALSMKGNCQTAKPSHNQLSYKHNLPPFSPPIALSLWLYVVSENIKVFSTGCSGNRSVFKIVTDNKGEKKANVHCHAWQGTGGRENPTQYQKKNWHIFIEMCIFILVHPHGCSRCSTRILCRKLALGNAPPCQRARHMQAANLELCTTGED